MSFWCYLSTKERKERECRLEKRYVKLSKLAKKKAAWKAKHAKKKDKPR